MNTVKKAPTKKVAKKIVTIEKPKPLPLSTVTYNYVTKLASIIFPNVTTQWSISLEDNPTNNCQLYSIRGFNGLLENLNNARYLIPENEKKNQLQHVLYKFSEFTGKKLVLIDINEEYIGKTEKLIDEDKIGLKQEYTSSNGSKMCLFLIRTDGYEFDYYDDYDED